MDRVFVLGGVWLCQQLVYSSVPLNVLLCVLLRPVMCFSSDVSATGEAPMFPSFSSLTF